jgi:hypothetical protein
MLENLKKSQMIEFKHFQLWAKFQRVLLNRSENIELYLYFLAILYIPKHVFN